MLVTELLHVYILYVLSVAWTQASWSMQQASMASQGASPGHPVYDTPQYLP
jgi:uncharacterized membrane protein